MEPTPALITRLWSRSPLLFNEGFRLLSEQQLTLWTSKSSLSERVLASCQYSTSLSKTTNHFPSLLKTLTNAGLICRPYADLLQTFTARGLGSLRPDLN